ncbi:MAG: Gfo/Idh/MocA family oxidoreductase [Thermoguttaceae bacterium]|nr:Gfo/Idh/MocA family oxidoreductase [Thermoguttaceae bacterium]
MSMQTTRRDFLKASTVAGVGFMVAAGAAPKVARASALQDLAIAGIGVGGKGASDITQAGYYGKVVAICDTDRGTLESKAKEFEGCKTYTNYKDLYAEMMDKIDAVTVSTPDHMHTIITAEAIKAGKHAYTQKPLTRTIGEARYLGYLAKKYGVCTQMGNQGSTLDAMRRCVAQIKAGAIGEILKVHIWTNRPVWAQGPNRDMTMDKFIAQTKKEEEDEEVAQDLIDEKKKQVEEALKKIDWDSWIGVAPKRDFWPGIYHDFQWRGWWDFGSGSLGDMACHTANMPYGACDLKFPTEVVAESSGHDFNSFPASSKIWFQFPATENRGAIEVTWFDAKAKPEASIFEEYGIENPTDSGAIIIGSEGAAYSPDDYAQSYQLLKKGGEKIVEKEGVEWRKAPEDEHSGNFDARNKLEWVTAIKENNPDLCWSNFPKFAGPLTETILLGNLAVWAAPKAGERGETIKWDAKKLNVTNLAEIKTPGVAELVRPEYQNGYEKIDWSFIDET